MKAVVLCAGYGKRMQPYTNTVQKSMLPIHGKPLLEYIIEGVKFSGIKECIIVVGYLKEQIFEYFQEGSKWDITIEYVEQKNLNGTGGAVLLIENLITGSHFLTVYGDILVPYRIYKEVIDLHKEQHEQFVLVSNYLENIQKGCSIITDHRYLVNMVEKPLPNNILSNWNNCGIYIFSTDLFKVLHNLTTSTRGEKELPDAILTGIKENNWSIRVLKMNKNLFRGDFGDKEEYERLKNDTSWLIQLKK